MYVCGGGRGGRLLGGGRRGGPRGRGKWWFEMCEMAICFMVGFCFFGGIACVFVWLLFLFFAF